MQESCGPMAWANSAATTDESTPPESPQITRSSPTRRRTASTVSRAKSPSFHVPEQWQTGVRKLPRILRAFGRVGHFGMELQPVDRQLPMLDRGQRAGVGGGQRQEIVGDLRHLIAVAHPDVDLVGNAGEQFVRPDDAAACPAVFAGRRALHLAAQRLAGQLHSVADAQHGQPEAEDFRIALRRARLVDAGRPAGEDDPLGGQLADPLGREVVADDLAIDVLLAHPPGDQLRVLRAEIEHQHLFVGQPRHCPPSGGKPSIIAPEGRRG